MPETVPPVASRSQAVISAAPFPDPIPGIFSFGSICTLAGAAGVGKNALVSEWVARWLQGRTICKRTTNCPTAIGMLAGDRRWRSHRHWLDVAECADIPYYSLRDDPKFDWNKLRNWQSIKLAFNLSLDKLNLPPGGLVILDPLALWLSGRVNEYKDIAIGLGTLDQLLFTRQLSALGIFHQSKQRNDATQQYRRPQDRILGSAAQLGFSDTAMYLLAPEDLDEAYYGFGWVPHTEPSGTFKFSRGKNGLFIPYTGVSDEGTTVDTDRPTQILLLLPEEDGAGLERHRWYELVREVVDVSLATFKRDIQTLLDRGLVVKDGYGKYARRKLQ